MRVTKKIFNATHTLERDETPISRLMVQAWFDGMMKESSPFKPMLTVYIKKTGDRANIEVVRDNSK